MTNLKLYLLYLFFAYSIQSLARGINNPCNFGLYKAKNGIERYYCILKCHKDAIEKNALISYKGIKSIDIEIPKNAEPIPLSNEVDFAGVHLNVLNRQKRIALFTRIGKSIPIQVPSKSIDNGMFKNDSYLCSGLHMLVIEDGVPWVKKRKGYDYGATRKDVLVVKNGIAANRVCSKYDNNTSIPKVYIVEPKNSHIYKNVVLNRHPESTEITMLFLLNNVYDITLSNIIINTPQNNKIFGDAAIQIKNSALIRVEDVIINGTYSQNGYGYGINLDNVSFFTAVNIYARANWGVFGTYNVNRAVLMDCDINRFDIHCYGRDVRCYNCKFSDMYNQFSSVFGDVYFEKCIFQNCRPVLIESSFNAYTPFELTFKRCIFNLNSKWNYILTLIELEEAHNSRPELSRKSLPNITIKNCTVNLTDDMKEWYIVNTGKVLYKEPLDYISKIVVKRLTINGNVDYRLFSTKLETTNPLRHVRKRVRLKKR